MLRLENLLAESRPVCQMGEAIISAFRKALAGGLPLLVPGAGSGLRHREPQDMHPKGVAWGAHWREANEGVSATDGNEGEKEIPPGRTKTRVRVSTSQPHIRYSATAVGQTPGTKFQFTFTRSP